MKSSGKRNSRNRGSEGSSEKYRKLQGKYLQVCRENARLRRELEKWVNWIPDEEVKSEEVIADKRLQCPECSAELNIIQAGQFKIYRCTECNYKKRINNEK